MLLRIVKVFCLMADITCNNLPSMKYAQLTSWIPNDNSYSINASVTYSCQTGYWFSPGNFFQSIICLSNGNWSAMSEACVGKQYKGVNR